MPVYDFTPRPNDATRSVGPDEAQHIDLYPPGISQLSDVEDGRHNNWGDPIGTQPEYVEEYLMPGFTALDEAMKSYWSGLRVPTKDSYRLMRVKIAGGDKSVLVWKSLTDGGRAKMPVASINRLSHEFNKDKFSPPHHAMACRYTSNRLDRMALVRRPVPFLVEYEMIVWAEWKRDLEYILPQILTRFNSLAEFTMNDGHITGNVQLRFGGSTDASDKEVEFNQDAIKRYEFRMTAESWLPLPEKIVPTILGRIQTISERDSGEYLSAVVGDHVIHNIQRT